MLRLHSDTSLKLLLYDANKQ